ncbi:MAG: carbohydrate porin, partial [Planctomycetota bacterium]
EQAFGVEGGTAFIQYLSVNPEQGGSLDSGDLQVYSNIENDRHLDVIFELWYEQVLLDGMIRFKIGKIDVNSEFAFVDVAGDFSNSSAGFSPTILAFPSYPDSAMSVNVFITMIDSPSLEMTLGYGYYDGASGVDDIRTGARGPSSFFSTDGSDDSFHIAQLDFGWGGSADDEERTGRLMVGGWHHTGEFARFDGGTDEGVWGAFLTVEQEVIGGDNGPSLTLFGQLGFSDEDVSEVSHHLAIGAVSSGFPWREDDSAGIYVTFAGLSDKPGAGFTDDEVAIDLYYRHQATPAVFVQPELQYIANPSGGGVDDALVGGLRVGVAF